MLIRPVLVLLLSIFCAPICFANNSEPNTFDLTLRSDAAISITQFGDGGDRILWIPSEHGINKEKHYDLLSSLAKLHHEIWLTETHESYFIPSGRSSYTKIPVDDIAELILFKKEVLI